MDGLAAYHLTFIVVSHCEEGYVHHDTTNTGDKVFNVIIPLETVPDSPPELIIGDDQDGHRVGRLKYEENVAVMIGDDVMHATSECDYRNIPGAMRLAATVYIADINEDNVDTIAETTLTQAFPLPDAAWVMSQRARHWENSNKRHDIDDKAEAVHFVGDRGRAPFHASDRQKNFCLKKLKYDMSRCETEWETRESCPATCGVYLDSSYRDEFMRASRHQIE